jgi:secreted Zn-dependent insulinase-like peptidase
MNIRLIITLCFIGFGVFLYGQETEIKKDINGEDYISYANDPSESRWYTLENGLTVILAKNSIKPRVQTLIATKAGSSSDPSEKSRSI